MFVCNGCHDLLQKCTSFDDAVIVTVNGHDCRMNFWLMTKSETVNIVKNADLNKKVEIYNNKKIIYYKDTK